MSLSAERFRPQKVRPWRGCANKARYDTFHQAERYRMDCERIRGHRLRVYDCEACGGWHLTSVPYRGKA